MNDGRHETQDATRSLESRECRPIGVESVEYLRMDRIGGLDPSLVIEVAALRREFLLLRAVKVVALARNGVPCDKLCFFSKRLKQTPPYDLAAFLSTRWCP